jgi:hypothetical protein
LPNLSMVALALMLTQRARIRLLSTGVAVAFSPVVYLSRYLTTSFWRGLFIALRSKKWSHRFAEGRLFFHSLSVSNKVGKCLPTFCTPVFNRAHRSFALGALSLNQFITLIYFPLLAAFSSVRIEPAAMRKPNSIATLKGNFYETYSRCRRRGGWS